MRSHLRNALPSGYRMLIIPALILVVGMLLTATLVMYARGQAQAAANQAFRDHAMDLVTGVRQSLYANAQILRGVRGLFNGSNQVSRDEFQSYVSRLELSSHYPGIESIGYVQMMPHDQVPSMLDAIHADGAPWFEITPRGVRREYAPVVYLTSFAHFSTTRLGEDFLMDPARRWAALQSRDSAEPVLSGRLVGEDMFGQKDARKTILILPVYTSGNQPATPALRQKALQGWTFAALNIQVLLQGFWHTEAEEHALKMHLQVYDGDTVKPDALMFSDVLGEPETEGDKVTFVVHSDLFEGRWTYVFQSRLSDWLGVSINRDSYVFGVSGIILSFLLATLAWMSASRHQFAAASLARVAQGNRALAEQGSLLLAIYDSSSVAIFLVDPQGVIQHANKRLSDIMLIPAGDEPKGAAFIEMIKPEDQGKVLSHLKLLYQKDKTNFSLELQCVRRDGRLFWGKLTGRPMWSMEGNVSGVVFALEDITEQRAIAETMRLSDNVFKASPNGIMVTDSHNNLIAVNPGFTRLTGYSEEEALGRNPRFLKGPGQGDAFYQDMWQQLASKGSWEGELVNRRKDGSVYTERLQITQILNDQGEVVNYLGMFQDVTERHQAEERIRFLALHDYLTGLPNRAALIERAEQLLEQAKRYNRRFAILFLDLDKFKPINDQYGHEAGDAVLQAVAGQLQTIVRAADTVCRQGGDEFVILLSELQPHGSLRDLAERLLHAVETPCSFNGVTLSVSGSLGISIYPDDGATISEVIQQADSAMYIAKQLPSPHICFAGDIRQEDQPAHNES